MSKYTRRATPRRVIQGIIVNHELQWFEVRVRQLHSVVDVFVILESTIASSGQAKNLTFYDAFQDGFLKEFQHKILYVKLDDIPQDYIDDGWRLEMYLRQYWSQNGLKRIKNLQDDDLIMNFDADEIPTIEVCISKISKINKTTLSEMKIEQRIKDFDNEIKVENRNFHHINVFF